MDEYIDPQEDYRCSKCGIMLDSKWAEGGDDEHCGHCVDN